MRIPISQFALRETARRRTRTHTQRNRGSDAGRTNSNIYVVIATTVEPVGG